MNEKFEGMVAETVASQERVAEMIEKLFTVTQAGAVFSEPITVEGQTIITASEIAVGMGLGFGIGAGSSDPGKGHKKKGHKASEGGKPGDEPEGEESDIGVGGGGGGGGGANGRPVAVISISEKGVQVEPVVDATKIALALFTALGSMFFMLSKMRKVSQ